MAVVLAVLVTALALMWIESVVPGRQWPRVSGWWARALALSLCQAAVALAAGRAWDSWLCGRRLFSADGLGPVGGAAVGYFAITFVYYWWHRARHASPLLWRVFHQLHHSPQRIEILTTFYKHPAEVLVNGLLSSTILFVGLGLSREAAAGAVALTGLAELAYHWNIKAPHWVGYLFQRPESRCVHHQEGLHSFNYSDLPLWDILFGTFQNPRRFEDRCGLGAGEHELALLLRGVDLTARPPMGAA